ncbi:protein starmaker-like [Cydia amplana]|uniref:protein starmaker-like n=1 Tax=Cydia amplana TaxID=1869771 RepID=UPI002FE57309
MSAVALQKRWFELKQDTRRRFRAQMDGKAGPPPLPIHQAIARRYGYVVTRSAHQVWRYLVTSGQVAPPTSERGPAPGEDAASRNTADDDSSDSDTARAEDDDDVSIVEKNLETIDLSEDIKEKDKTKEVVTTKEKPAAGSKTEGLGHETGEKDEIIIVENATANTSDKPTVRSQKRKSSKHGNKPGKNHPSRKNKKVSKHIDKTIDINKEIVDLDAPSPNTDVVEALQELDVNNFETTIVFDSDDEDVDKEAEVPNDANEDSVPGTNDNDNESQVNDKAEKRYQRESSDSSNGNLVIDDNVNSEIESSDNDAEDTTLGRSNMKYNIYDKKR